MAAARPACRGGVGPVLVLLPSSGNSAARWPPPSALSLPSALVLALVVAPPALVVSTAAPAALLPSLALPLRSLLGLQLPAARPRRAGPPLCRARACQQWHQHQDGFPSSPRSFTLSQSPSQRHHRPFQASHRMYSCQQDGQCQCLPLQQNCVQIHVGLRLHQPSKHPRLCRTCSLHLHQLLFCPPSTSKDLVNACQFQWSAQAEFS